MKTETAIIATDYDFEAVRSLAVFCDCGRTIPDDALERLSDEPYRCRCGKVVNLAELDALADSMEQPIPQTNADKP